jgi:hypothetical protein
MSGATGGVATTNTTNNDQYSLVSTHNLMPRDSRGNSVCGPRAYPDRLDLLFIASGWTPKYTVHTRFPASQSSRDKRGTGRKVRRNLTKGVK